MSIQGGEDSDLSGSNELIPVAQYVRMSTEHQRYSTENQAEAIAAYARQHGMAIVRTYRDDGKSGLNIEGREGLRSLLRDVTQASCNYAAVLVYDVSRWGRFPDPDEAAVYEYTCKQHGVSVLYCAEQFSNDSSLSSTILKNLKRSMSAEYSRELSVKVFAGHRTLVLRGFRQGGAPGFGLRRQLVDQDNNVKGLLHTGERKSIQTDRILLVPGPEEEVEIVQRIYSLFLEDGQPERVIASTLNREGVLTDRQRPWTRGTVHQVLTNEKYIGNNVYNRTSFKLKIAHRRNPPDEWIRRNGAYVPIVPIDWFLRVQSVIAARTRHLVDSEMLNLLKQLLTKHGALSGILIDEQEGMPSSSAYRVRFGSLLRAYSLVGYRPKRDYEYLQINRALRRLHPEYVAEVANGVRRAGGWATSDPITELLTVNGEFTASVVIARCKPTPAGAYRWRIRLDVALEPDITVVVRMNRSNDCPLDYYLLPSFDFTAEALPRAEENGFALDAYQFSSLDPLYLIAARSPLKEVA